MKASTAARTIARGAAIALLPLPNDQLRLTPAEVHSRFVGRVIVILLTALSNLSAYLSLRGRTGIDTEWLTSCVIYIEASIALDLVLALLFSRRMGRAYWPVTCVQTVLEIATLIVWIHATGLSTSYFTMTPSFFVLVMRNVYDYRVALVTVLTSIGLYVLAYVLEAKGLIPVAPIIADAAARFRPGADFRQMVLVYATSGYFIAFIVANVVRYGILRKDLALLEARQNLRRAVDQARLGRLSGTRLGEYGIEDLLGRGGMGEVYAARRQGDGKEVAIKLLHAHLGSDERMRMRFRREAEVVSKMPAGTVAKVFQFGTNEDGYDYIVMERLRGEDMAALLRRRERLELEELVAIVHQVARGLDAAHQLGVVHRDLKPQNVFMCGEPGTGEAPDVRLLDFGVARLHEAAMAPGMTATAAVLGTPGYMPPEQAAGGKVGPAADIFALGAIVYRALTGKPAFPSRSPAGALFEALHHDPPPPSESVGGLHKDVDAVLALALAKEPGRRYQRASHLASDLDAAARGQLHEDSRARAARLERTAIGTAMTMTGDGEREPPAAVDDDSGA